MKCHTSCFHAETIFIVTDELMFPFNYIGESLSLIIAISDRSELQIALNKIWMLQLLRSITKAPF